MHDDNGLRAIQAAFAAAILDAGEVPAPGLVRERGLSARQRLNVYYNHTRIVQEDALRAIYPALRRLVGDECFSGVAALYAQQYPLRRGDLRTFGEQLADFLDTFEPLAALPYAADVARLEWACHEALHSGVAPVSPSLPGQVTVAAHMRLLRSPFPVAGIWEFALSDHAADGPRLDISDSGPSHLLVMRPHLDVEVYALPVDDWDWLAGLVDRAVAPDRLPPHEAQRCRDWLRSGALVPCD